MLDKVKLIFKNLTKNLQSEELTTDWISKANYNVIRELQKAYAIVKPHYKWVKFEEFVNVYRIVCAFELLELASAKPLAIVVPKYFLSYVTNINYVDLDFILKSFILNDLHGFAAAFVPAYWITTKRYKLLIKDKRYGFIGACCGVQFYMYNEKSISK